MKLYIGSYFSFFTSDRNHWVEIDLKKPTQLSQILTELGIPIPEVYLVIVNSQLVESLNINVSNDDIVKLYPAIGGG